MGEAGSAEMARCQRSAAAASQAYDGGPGDHEPRLLATSRRAGRMEVLMDMSSTATVRLEIDEAIATLTLDRPAVLNAMDAQLARDLAQLLHRLEGSDGVRVVIIRGAGAAFCAGGDIGSFLA